FNLRLAPHLWTGAPGFAAGMHVSAASPAGFILEYSLAKNPLLHDLSEPTPVLEDGMLEIPERPGLGLKINEDFVRHYAMR
ncbi:MAG: mandelate racemase/muconate lactonizing enzyme family protein, partial [Betaproteobacteria bacterium]|nr:mandelate racemase/muconate lactonizing enzyme family protein [Betaproteobacteria bacterium]